MQNRIPRSWLVTLAGAACALSLAAASGLDAAPRRVAPPTLKFSETLGERVVCEAQDGELVCEEVDGGRCHINGSIPLGLVDSRGFNADTPVYIQLNGFEFEAVLGQDPFYRPGKTRAKFVMTSLDENGAPIVVGRVVVRWDRARAHFALDGRTGTELFLESIAASEYREAPEGSIAGATTATLAIGDAGAEYEVSLRGRVNHRKVRRAGVEFERSSVRLEGRGIPQ